MDSPGRNFFNKAMRTKIILITMLSMFVISVFALSAPALALISQPIGSGGGVSSGSSSNSNLGSSSCTSKPTFFGLVPWYEYLKTYPIPNPNLHHPVCGICFDVFGNQSQSYYNSSGKLVTPCKANTSNGKNSNNGAVSDIFLVLLAIVDDLLRVAGLIAVGMVLYSSGRFITSQGEPDGVAKARSSIINALIGTAIALFAIVIVSYLGSTLGGK